MSEVAQTAAAQHRPATSEPLVAIDDVRFTWPGKRGFTLAIEQFAISRGERVLIVGPSGGGKSTFLGLLCGTLQPASGSIAMLGADIAKLSASQRDRFRADHIGIVFQMFNLLPYCTVIDNVVLPLSFGAARRARIGNGQAARTEAARLLTRLGLDVDELGHERASSLSVGQQQRVAAARRMSPAAKTLAMLVL